MNKRLLLLLFVFVFIYLHKLERMLRRSKVETHCQSFPTKSDEVYDCVACLNTERLTSSTLRFYVNNIDDQHKEVDFYGNVKILKQQKCIQYVCSELLDTKDFGMGKMGTLLEELTMRVTTNVTLDSKNKKDEVDVEIDKDVAGVALRMRLVEPSKKDLNPFVTVRYPQEDITERLAISLSGVIIPGLNLLMLLAFVPGLEGVMQGYMVWVMLKFVTKYRAFPVLYAIFYAALSYLTSIPLYRNIYFLVNVLLALITLVSSPNIYSVAGTIVTLICTSSEYYFTTKDLVWTSTIVGFYLTLLGQCNREQGEKGSWSPVNV